MRTPRSWLFGTTQFAEYLWQDLKELFARVQELFARVQELFARVEELEKKPLLDSAKYLESLQEANNIIANKIEKLEDACKWDGTHWRDLVERVEKLQSSYDDSPRRIDLLFDRINKLENEATRRMNELMSKQFEQGTRILELESTPTFSEYHAIEQLNKRIKKLESSSLALRVDAHLVVISELLDRTRKLEQDFLNLK